MSFDILVSKSLKNPQLLTWFIKNYRSAVFCDLSQCGKVDIEYQELAWQLPSICGIIGFPFSLLLAKLGFIVLKILDIQVLIHSLGIL